MKRFVRIDERPTCVSLMDFVDNHLEEKVSDPANADCILIGGGDGFMLDSMRKYHTYQKPFLGVNCGTLGFMLNKFDKNSFQGISLIDLSLIEAKSIIVELTMDDGTKSSGFFLNDCVIGGSVLDYVRFSVEEGKEQESIVGTGLVVNTMLGSTGYALNLGQPLIPVESSMRGVAGIATAPFNYSFVKPQPISISWNSRSPVVVGLDGYNSTFKNVQSIDLIPSDSSVWLAFLPGQNFAEKRILLAEEKLGR